MTSARLLGFARARDRLLRWQPTATSIKMANSTCPVCHTSHFVSYRILSCVNNPPIDETIENCGYYCGGCGYGNAGARKKS
jgi:C4-type Zn-finger protein